MLQLIVFHIFLFPSNAFLFFPLEYTSSNIVLCRGIVHAALHSDSFVTLKKRLPEVVFTTASLVSLQQHVKSRRESALLNIPREALIPRPGEGYSACFFSCFQWYVQSSSVSSPTGVRVCLWKRM